MELPKVPNPASSSCSMMLVFPASLAEVLRWRPRTRSRQQQRPNSTPAKASTVSALSSE